MKIKVVIIDDDLTSRNTIKMLMNNNDLYEIVADFSNGKTAIDWIRTNEIDILLCDMQMPEMNGVELMRIIHIINEYLPIIVISAYNDFDYLRGSLINGADNYLLKHELTKEKLIECLDQVREKYRIIPEERMIRYRAGYCFSNDFEFNAKNINKMTQEEKIDFNCNHVVPMVISPDYYFSVGINKKEYKINICAAIQDMIGQILKNEYKYVIYISPRYQITLLISFFQISSMLYTINAIKNFTNRLQRLTMRMMDMTLTISYGDIQIDLESSMLHLKKLQQIVDDKLYLGGNRVIPLGLYKEIIYSDKKINNNLMMQLEFEVKNYTKEILHLLKDILGIVEKDKIRKENIYQLCEQCLLLLEKNDFLKKEEINLFLSDFKNFETYEQFKSNLLEIYNDCINRKDNITNQYSDLIKRVINYMEENYMQDISLETCAEYVNTSYTNLSREFKKETKYRFVEFLNMLRIKKAKSLLIRDENTMKEIVEYSGFRNYNYFFKVFKEYEGITPSEFIAKK